MKKLLLPLSAAIAIAASADGLAECEAVSPQDLPNFLASGGVRSACVEIPSFGTAPFPGDAPCRDAKAMYRRAVRMAVACGRRFKKDVRVAPESLKGESLASRNPSIGELRWQMWEAVRAGAKGVVFPAPPDAWRWSRVSRRFSAAKGEYGVIERRKAPLLRADIAPFPVFFPAPGEPLKCQTFFERGSAARFGVLVNDDLEREREFEVCVPDNVEEVKALGGAEFALSAAENGLRRFKIVLPPGGGEMVEAKAAGDEPGILFVHEDFGRTHWMGWVNTDAVDIGLSQCYGLKGETTLRLKEGYTNELPVAAYWAADLANPESGGSWNMASMNVNAKTKRANVWAAFDAECDDGVELWAHMGDARNKAAEKRRFWKKGDPLPVQVPVGTGVAFVKLGSKSGVLVSLDIWSTPLARPEPKDPPVRRSACAGKTLPLTADFPLGVYHGWERNDVNAKYAGLPYDEFVDRLMGVCTEMNCDTIWVVNGPRKGQREKFLETCSRRGLKALFNTGMENLQGYFHHEFDGDFGALESAVNRFVSQTTDYPSFWGFTTKDEPLYKLATQIDDFAELTKRLDPAKRDTVVCATPPSAIPYIEATRAPVIAVDPYCFGGPRSRGDVFAPAESSRRVYRGMVAEYAKAARLSGKNLWILPQAYSWIRGLEWLDGGGRRILEKGSYWIYRMPTEGEIRWQTWEAVRGGAKGIVYYVLSDSWTMDEEYFEIAKTNKSYAAQVQRAKDQLKNVPELRREPERHEIDPARALMLRGLEPSRQFKALGEVYGRLKKSKELLLSCRVARAKALWNGHGPKQPLAVETFERDGDAARYGIVLNDDTDGGRELVVTVPGSVVEVADAASGERYALSDEKDATRTFKVSLAAGDGRLVSVKFRNGLPGRSLVYDDFTEPHRMGMLDEEYGELALSGKFFRSSTWILRMKDKGQKYDGPLYTISGIARRVGSAPAGAGGENGATWLAMDGYLHGVTVKAVAKGEDGKEVRTVVFKPNGTSPVRVPAGTEALEFNVSHHSSSVSYVNIWYNPL